tara:strand:+ start:224 stop:715 length:492 start_codon:yes stop_codon:yes gene_type:complete
MFNINYDAILKKLNLRKDKPRDEDLATVRVVSHGKYNPDLESQRLHEVVTTQEYRSKGGPRVERTKYKIIIGSDKWFSLPTSTADELSTRFKHLSNGHGRPILAHTITCPIEGCGAAIGERCVDLGVHYLRYFAFLDKANREPDWYNDLLSGLYMRRRSDGQW